MRVNRNYFYFVVIGFLFPFVIYSCFDVDSQKKSVKEQSNSNSKNKSSITHIERGSVVDTFIFKIHPDLPNFVFIIPIDSGVLRNILIYNSADSNLIQNINYSILLNRSPDIVLNNKPGYGNYFFTRDFNFDGFQDIVLLEEYGATGNISYVVWLYNKSKNIFETDDFFKSIDRPILDERKKQITTYVEYGGFDEYLERTYKLKNNKFILMYEVKYWRDYKGDHRNNNYLQMKDSSISYKDTLKLVSRKIVGP